MKKFKFIDAVGTDDFQKQLQSWFDENQDATIISIDHTTNHTDVPGGPQRMIVYNLTALIVYNEN